MRELSKKGQSQAGRIVVPPWQAERSAKLKRMSLLNHPVELKKRFEPIRDLEGDAKFEAAVRAVADLFEGQKGFLAADLKPTSPGITAFIGLLFEDEYLPHGRRYYDILRLIELAKEDWKAYQVLRFVADVAHQDLQIDALSQWRIRDWGGHIPVPKLNGGQLANYYRNAVIVRVIEALVDLGFNVKRNDAAAATTSACDVIEQAGRLVGLGTKFSFKATARVWDRHRRSMPPVMLIVWAMMAAGLEW